MANGGMNEGVPDQRCDNCGGLTDPDELRYVADLKSDNPIIQGVLKRTEFVCEECYQQLRSLFAMVGTTDPEEQ